MTDVRPSVVNQTFTPIQLVQLKKARALLDAQAAEANSLYLGLLKGAEAIAAKQALRGPEPDPASPTFEIS